MKNKLNEKQELFCQYYVSKDFFGNGVRAYAEAYNIDLTQKAAYRGARASASRLLTDANVLNRINELLDDAGLNDSFVDKQLLFLINQNADFSAKIAAIREYNALKSRITNKTDITSGGQRIVPILGGASDVSSNNGNKEDSTT